MKEFVLRAAVAVIRAVAAFIGFLVKSGDGILLISCQSDEPTQDISDLAEAIGRLPGTPRVAVIAGRMERSAGGAFAFAGKMLLMLKAIAAARVVVLDAYCPAVSIPKKRCGKTVVQLWHAPEAIKKFSLQILDTDAGYDRRTAEILCMHRGYDHILCPSDATRPFFAEAFGYSESAFVKYGLPSLDRIGKVKRPAKGAAESSERIAARTAIRGRYFMPSESREGSLLTIVYAPTFRDAASVDAAGLVHAFERAAGESGIPVLLILKLHPLDASGCGVNAEDIGNRSYGGLLVIADTEFPLIDWYAAADAIITDYSGVTVEAAAAGAASYYYVYDMDDYAARRGLNVDLRTEAVGKYAFSDADLLAAQVMCDFAAGMAETYDYGALAVLADKYLEVPLTGNADRLAEWIASLARHDGSVVE